jgi:hypothetical protein
MGMALEPVASAETPAPASEYTGSVRPAGVSPGVPLDRSLDDGRWADPKAVEEHARRKGRFYGTRAADLDGD